MSYIIYIYLISGYTYIQSNDRKGLDAVLGELDKVLNGESQEIVLVGADGLKLRVKGVTGYKVAHYNPPISERAVKAQEKLVKILEAETEDDKWQ